MAEPHPAKVFCVGLNKTGTISLHEALEVLGYRSLHWGGPEVRLQVERARDEGRGLVDDLGAFDAYSDIWRLSENFDLLDQQYPGSRFILTIRPVDEWVESRRKHVERNIARRSEGVYSGDFLVVDEPAWREEHRRHHERVASYFAGRSDLLVMSIVDGDGYEALCPFLGVDHPGVEFPARHRATPHSA